MRPTRAPRLAVAVLGLLTACGGDDGAPPPAEAPTLSVHLDHAEAAAGRVSLGDLFGQGERLFVASFNALDGAGRPTSTGTGAPRAREDFPRNVNRVSGPDASACSGCHSMPRAGGGGDNVANVFVLAQRFPFVNFDGGPGDGSEEHTLTGVGNERNTPGMWGGGYVELLAREMTRDLRALRDAALAGARAGGSPVATDLVAKGVSFGRLTARPDGTVDASQVVGVDSDLVVKPWHQKGVVSSLRVFTNNAMNHHHGIQSAERFGEGTDADADGLADELSDGDVTATTLWQALLPPPGRVLPEDPARRAAADRGEALFEAVGCAQCHVPYLRLEDAVFREPGPYNPPGNLVEGDGRGVVAVDLSTEGPSPRLPREGDGSVLVPLYSDLKRHDMGPGLANEALVQAGVPPSAWLTKRLWGFASEPPYLHHGRATLISDAILAHGGEGQASRDAFAALPPASQDDLVEFLKTLQVLPDGETSLVVEGTDPSTVVGDAPAVEEHVTTAEAHGGLATAEELIARGRALFVASFNELDGSGRPECTGTGAARSRHEGFDDFNRISGPDANACSGCHSLPRAGGGGDVVANVFVLAQRFPCVLFANPPGAGDGFEEHTLLDVGDERNTTGMWGGGFVELLAREMSRDLAARRDEGLARAAAAGAPVPVDLVTKGVSFGRLVARPDGTVDASQVVGVDADLVVKPWHQKGVVSSLRVFTNNALNHHHGIQSVERFGAGADPDADGVVDEATDGDVTALALFQATLPVPGRVLPAVPGPRSRIERGEALFAQSGCAECHVPYLVLDDPVYTEPGPYNGAGNLGPSGVPSVRAVDLTVVGPGPRLRRGPDGKVRVPLFSDLKRHDMGPGLAAAVVQAGVPQNQWLTRRLWGLVSEPPYLHHGRATLVSEAILAHGGEGQASRDAFAALSAEDRDAVLAFLGTLQVLPEGAMATEVVR